MGVPGTTVGTSSSSGAPRSTAAATATSRPASAGPSRLETRAPMSSAPRAPDQRLGLLVHLEHLEVDGDARVVTHDAQDAHRVQARSEHRCQVEIP